MDAGLDEDEQHRNPFLNNDSDGNPLCSHVAPTLQYRSEGSVARWDKNMGMGEIVEMKGSIWSGIGVIRNGGKLYCTIEELLFLVERGALCLLDGNEGVLSLNDIYKKISEGKYGCSWECFAAYRHLKSLGYIVRRHGLPWVLNREMEDGVHVVEMFKGMQVNELKLEFDVFLPNNKFKKSSPGNPHFVLCLASDKPPSRGQVENLERQCKGVPLKFCNVDHGRVSFFSFDRIELPVLP